MLVAFDWHDLRIPTFWLTQISTNHHGFSIKYLYMSEPESLFTEKKFIFEFIKAKKSIYHELQSYFVNLLMLYTTNMALRREDQQTISSNVQKVLIIILFFPNCQFSNHQMLY